MDTGQPIPTPTLRLRTCSTRAELHVEGGPCKMIPNVRPRPLDGASFALAFFQALFEASQIEPPPGGWVYGDGTDGDLTLTGDE